MMPLPRKLAAPVATTERIVVTLICKSVMRLKKSVTNRPKRSGVPVKEINNGSWGPSMSCGRATPRNRSSISHEVSDVVMGCCPYCKTVLKFVLKAKRSRRSSYPFAKSAPLKAPIRPCGEPNKFRLIKQIVFKS